LHTNGLRLKLLSDKTLQNGPLLIPGFESLHRYIFLTSLLTIHYKAGNNRTPVDVQLFVIKTRRLILRSMREDDAEALLDIFSDPIAMQYFGVIFD